MTEVRLTKAKTFEFDPEKKYIIQVKEGALRREDVGQLSKAVSEMGIKATIVSLPKGRSLKVMERKKEKPNA